MINRRKMFYVAFAWAPLLVEGASAQTPSPLQVDAIVDHKGKKLAVSFRITNNSSEAIVVNESALPWGDRYGVLLFVVTKREQQPMKAGYPVSDVFLRNRCGSNPKRQLVASLTYQNILVIYLPL